MRMSEVTDEVISQEERIVWLDKPDKYPYLRETVIHCSFKKRLPAKHYIGFGLVAYAELKDDAVGEYPGWFNRRFWFFKSHDPYTGRGAPIEGVCPFSIKVGQVSADPDIAWEGTCSHK